MIITWSDNRYHVQATVTDLDVRVAVRCGHVTWPLYTYSTTDCRAGNVMDRALRAVAAFRQTAQTRDPDFWLWSLRVIPSIRHYANR